MNRGLMFGALALLFVLTSCPDDLGGKAKASTPITVWADPALKQSLNALEPLFLKKHRPGWNIEYMESSQMDQMSLGVFPDVLLTIEPKAQELLKVDVLDESTMRTFAGDLLCVVTPRANPLDLPKLGDLIVTQFKALGVGSKDTSEGYYAKQALISDGAMAKVKDQLKEYGSLDDLVAAVSAGTLDFGIVYASTAAQHQELKIATPIPEDLYTDIRYSAIASKPAAHNHGVMELLKLLAEDPETQKLLGSFGYVDRATAMEETK